MKIMIPLTALLLLLISSISLAADGKKPLVSESSVAKKDSSFDNAKMPGNFEIFMKDIKFKNPTGLWHLANSPIPTPVPQQQMEKTIYHPDHGQPDYRGHHYVPRSGYESLTPEQRRQIMQKPSGW